MDVQDEYYTGNTASHKADRSANMSEHIRQEQAPLEIVHA